MKIQPCDHIKSGDDGYYRFECPGCKDWHSIPLTKGGEIGRAWGWNGSLDSPTIHPSIFVNQGGRNPTAPICHSFVRDGMIQFLPDCSHELAGQTVELPLL